MKKLHLGLWGVTLGVWGAAGAQTIDYAAGDNLATAINTTAVTTLNNLDAGVATQSGPITGPGSVVKTGPGTLNLTAANSYAGGTVLSAGTLMANSDTALGTGVLAVQGGTIGSQTNAVLANAMAINGDFAVTIGGPGVPPAPPALSILGDVVLGADARITLTAPSTFALGGGISGNHGLVLDATSTTGNYVFKGTQPNTYTGLTRVQGNAILGLERNDGVTSIPGNLTIDGNAIVVSRTSEQIADTSVVTVNGNGNLGYQAFGFQGAGLVETIGALYGAGPVALSGSKLVVGSGDYSGAIVDGALGLTGGQLEKTGAGVLALSGANAYTGGTRVSGGTLRAAAANTLSAASAHTVEAGATLDTAGFSQTVASLANSGTVSLVSTAAGSALTVKGNYFGNNGLLRVGTVLANNGVSDQLVIDGGNASGRTTVAVTRIDGLGGATAGNGIEVIAARNGAATTAQATKDAFVLAGGHVDAGAYEYRLYAADAAGAGESWFLRADTPVLPPVVPPVDPGAGAGGGGGGGSPPVVRVPTYRAEVALLAALPEQLREGNYAMLGNMHQRIGDEDSGSRRAWGRVLSADFDVRQSGTVSPASRGRLTGFQAGTDLWADDRWRAGVYVGQLEGEMQVNGFARGVQNLAVGRNDLRNQYLGVYGTFRNADGLYADAVLQAGRHRYSLRHTPDSAYGGKGSSLLASI
ncbi:MAG: autotransporter outer membrane beta-barrel domain-containing protein, partial [Comamonadaceae bacterium]